MKVLFLILALVPSLTSAQWGGYGNGGYGNGGYNRGFGGNFNIGGNVGVGNGGSWWDLWFAPSVPPVDHNERILPEDCAIRAKKVSVQCFVAPCPGLTKYEVVCGCKRAEYYSSKLVCPGD